MGYDAWIFDCDGVILDSNAVKSKSFYNVAIQFGQTAADKMLVYHQQNGGISRFKKWEYFYTEILKRETNAEDVNRLIEQYADQCKTGLLECDETPLLRKVLESIVAPKYVASGSYENELKELLSSRSLSDYFVGIYGSPTSKLDIVQSIAKQHSNLVLIGDSRYDYETAIQCGIDFIFMYGFTEFDDWQQFFADKRVFIVENLESLL